MMANLLETSFVENAFGVFLIFCVFSVSILTASQAYKAKSLLYDSLICHIAPVLQVSVADIYGQIAIIQMY